MLKRQIGRPNKGDHPTQYCCPVELREQKNDESELESQQETAQHQVSQDPQKETTKKQKNKETSTILECLEDKDWKVLKVRIGGVTEHSMLAI